MRVFKKAPAAVLDFTEDYTSWLSSGDTISTSSWVVTSGLTKITDSKTSTMATVWLSGGTNGEAYLVTNRIVTTGGRTEDRSIVIHCVQT